MAVKVKTIHRRKSRKPSGKWKDLVVELRKRIEGADTDGKPRMGQTEFAKLFNVAPVTISRWERGVQDPPTPALEHLAIAACNLGSTDLEVGFCGGREPERTVSHKDRKIITLLACLFRWREMDRENETNAAIHVAAKMLFDTARNIVMETRSSSSTPGAAQEFMVGEMARLLKAVYDEEHDFFGTVMRSMGAPMYSETGGKK